MGLAPYGEPRYVDRIVGTVVDVKDDGSIWMDMSYFNYCQGPDDDVAEVRRAVRRPAAEAGESPITEREMDIAASIQKVTEDVDAEGGASRARGRPGRGICAWPAGSRSTASPTAGSCAKGPSNTSGFSRRRAMPAARSARRSTSGISCSATTARRGRDRQHARVASRSRRIAASSIARAARCRAARSYTEYRERRRAVRGRRRSHCRRECRWVVSGPDGVRSARARRPQHHRRRPQPGAAVHDEPEDQVPRIVPAVCAGRAARSAWPTTSRWRRTPTARTCCSWRRCSDDIVRTVNGEQARGLDKRERWSGREIPAVTHVDYSARVQTVDRERHGRFYDAGEAFERKTGCPVHHQHELQRARRADRLHARSRPTAASWRPTWTRSCSSGRCCSSPSSRLRGTSIADEYAAAFQAD